ncbi:MAG TPA: hypothetical protein VGD99_28985 [Anaerolineae bacterium]|jgi:hypothetical protein
MSRYLRYGIIEDLDTVRHIPVGRFWGVRLSFTPITWLSPFVFFGLHLILMLLIPGLSLTERLADALVFTLAVEVTNLCHAFGHILSGKIVGSPMDELLITATRDTNLYEGDQEFYPSHVHLGRALGGPVFNLIVAGLLYTGLPLMAPGLSQHLVTRIADINLFFGVGSFIPLPSVDGQVIWREILRSLRALFQEGDPT